MINDAAYVFCVYEMTGNAKLQQGKVSIAAIKDCRGMKFIGQYISNTNICVNSADVFTCPVSQHYFL